MFSILFPMKSRKNFSLAKIVFLHFFGHFVTIVGRRFTIPGFVVFLLASSFALVFDPTYLVTSPFHLFDVALFFGSFLILNSLKFNVSK